MAVKLIKERRMSRTLVNPVSFSRILCFCFCSGMSFVYFMIEVFVAMEEMGRRRHVDSLPKMVTR